MESFKGDRFGLDLLNNTIKVRELVLPFMEAIKRSNLTLQRLCENIQKQLSQYSNEELQRRLDKISKNVSGVSAKR